MRTEIVTKGISMWPPQWAVLEAISRANGGLGRSATVRMVIERFVRQERMVDIVKAQVAGLITPAEALDQLRMLVRTQPVHTEHVEAKAGAATE